MAKGFTQKEGIDYHEVFSPIVKHSSTRILLSIVVQFELELRQLDIRKTSLHGNLEETIYMKLSEGVKSFGKTEQVCLLKRSLHGLK